jgi:hypothetical protein
MADDSDICFVCGTPGADMRDHVLFDCLFVPPRPSNLLTLPARYRCQNKLQEEYFRNIAAGLGLDTSHTAHTLWEDKVYRSLQRNRPLRDSLRASLLRKVNLVSSGGIWLGTAPGIRIDRDRFYPALEKIIRGLYRYHMGRYLSANTIFNWAINEPLQGERLKIFQLAIPGISYPDVFECRFGVASDDKTEMSIWWLRFYQELTMRCMTRIDLKPTHDRASPTMAAPRRGAPGRYAASPFIV